MEADPISAAIIARDWHALLPSGTAPGWVLALGVAAVTTSVSIIAWWFAPLRYHAQPRLFTEAEWQFYQVLNTAVGQRFLIVGKVRIADVITPRATVRRQAWWRAFRKISSKHLDYVLLEPQSGVIRMALELDDSSHRRTDRRTRDRFVDRALAQAGVPLLRVVAARRYAPGEVQRLIAEALNRRN